MSTPFDQLIETITNLDPWSIVKAMVMLLLSLYIAFSFIVLRQVDLMRKTLMGRLNTVIKVIAFVHLGIAIFVWLLAFIIL